MCSVGVSIPFVLAGLLAIAWAGECFHACLGHAHPASYPFTLRYGKDEAERLSHPRALWRFLDGGEYRVLMVRDDPQEAAPG